MSGSDEGGRTLLAPDYAISRIIVGGWQFSRGHGGGAQAKKEALKFLSKLVDRGLTTFDCADIYTGVEELLGELLRMRRRGGSPTGLQIHTKFVPDLEILPSIHRDYVKRIIHRSLARLGVERLDLVQFHWWDFSVPGYVEVMHWLDELRKEGAIRHLGVTNFDEQHLKELVAAGAPVVSNQVQYSVLDRRPEKGLARYCEEEGISLLCYGGLAGGFLTEAFLGAPDPPEVPANRSLVKYRLIIGEIGGWAPYQALLDTLRVIARRYGVPIPCVALRWVLDRPGVAASITGLDSVTQAEETLRALELELDPESRRELEEVLDRMSPLPGPVYGLERDRKGPHGSIMKYNLNRE